MIKQRLLALAFCLAASGACAQNLTSQGDLKPPTCPSNKLTEAIVSIATTSTPLTGGTLISGPALSSATWATAYEAEVQIDGTSTAGLSKGGATLTSVANSPITFTATAALYTFPIVAGVVPTMISTSTQNAHVTICQR